MTAAAPSPPGLFQRAVAELSVPTRPEIELSVLPAPARLAPFSHAIGATVHDADGTEIGTGRLVLLHDPDGVEAWAGDLRLVAFLSCEVEPEVARDPLLPEVAWSWLTEALEDTEFTALGGTVTATASTRFGDISGPDHADDLELRASWTPLTAETGPHLRAFLAVLETATGLPPVGVTAIRVIERPNA